MKYAGLSLDIQPTRPKAEPISLGGEQGCVSRWEQSECSRCGAKIWIQPENSEGLEVVCWDCID